MSPKDFLVTPSKDYRNIIWRENNSDGSPHFPHDYSTVWKRFYTDAVDTYEANFLNERLKGAPLVDLGGAEGRLEEFAVFAEASAYINVDISPLGAYYKTAKDPECNLVPLEYAYIKNTQRLSICADMLDFISRLPDQFGNIMINGIYIPVIKTCDYNEALGQEMVRVTKNNGIILGHYSDSLDYAARQVEHRIHIIQDQFYSREQLTQSRLLFLDDQQVLIKDPTIPQPPLWTTSLLKDNKIA